uniref:Chitin-binding type-2 domain-containing protein n=1 Tax=Timema shepardi TaxID=629360 RepID=A0A7R9AVR2_TIMSH|nr:unnamed protein product [Timema shepardi]
MTQQLSNNNNAGIYNVLTCNSVGTYNVLELKRRRNRSRLTSLLACHRQRWNRSKPTLLLPCHRQRCNRFGVNLLLVSLSQTALEQVRSKLSGLSVTDRAGTGPEQPCSFMLQGYFGAVVQWNGRITSFVVALSVALIHVATATDVVCGSSQYMANPDDCSSFYECVGGVPVLIPCPIGLHYSKITHICDYPALAQCDPDYVAPTAEPTKEAPTVAPTEEVPDYYCPPTNDAGVVLYPSPCNLGQLEKLLCPEGLEYSASERACEYPEIANCDLNNLPSVDPNPVPTVSTPLTPNFDCSASSEDNPILYPSPHSCSDFYKCSEGLPILEHCPPGLDYNAKTSQCDYPQLAGCDSSVSQVTVVPTKSPGTVPTTDSPEGVYCPPDVQGLLVRNPLDCNSYYDCNYGLPQLEMCNEGLFFNQQLQECDWPVNVPEFTQLRAESVGKPLKENHPQYTQMGSNHDLPVIGSLFYCESSALDHIKPSLFTLHCHQQVSTTRLTIYALVSTHLPASLATSQLLFADPQSRDAQPYASAVWG